MWDICFKCQWKIIYSTVACTPYAEYSLLAKSIYCKDHVLWSNDNKQHKMNNKINNNVFLLTIIIFDFE